MNPIRTGIVVAVLLVGTALTGTAAVAAGSDYSTSDTNPEKEVRIVDEEIVIADGIVSISDTTLEGPGLGEQTIEDSEYTVDSTVRFDGFHVTHDDTRYTICRVTVRVEDIGIRLQNVTLTEGGNETAETCDC